MLKRTNLLAAMLIGILFSATAGNSPLWLRYPSISPDGSTIVFNYKGDIYKVAASGGEAIALTSHVGYDYNAVWSPDGSKIAFASDRFGNFDVFVMDIKGGAPERLTTHSAGEVPTSFSPDGKHILFTASIQDVHTNYQFPSGVLSELYSIPVKGGNMRQVLSTTAQMVQYNKAGNVLIYQDRKGYENEWRKHHTSSIARDIWKYDVNEKKHTQLTKWSGEDRNPVFTTDEKGVYFLSERFDSTFNVCRLDLDNPDNVKQLTKHKGHPVRFLSIANNGVMAYSFDGELYTFKEGEQAKKLEITIFADNRENNQQYMNLSGKATEMAVSPDGKEIAFIARGEVFVTLKEYGTTKRITNTPEQERNVSFHPDGRKLLYAAERNGSWNLYETELVRDEEKYFALSTVVKEKPLREVKAENFQPRYSPDGKEVAFLENRETLRVINLKSKEVRTVLEGKWNYSYSDGDQYYQWSPDGKWFLATYSPHQLFSNEVALVDAAGKKDITNLTLSGYNDNAPKWSLKGKAMIWFTDKNGLRSHGSWGSTYDVYAMFFDQEAYDKFKMTKAERELLSDKDDDDKKDDDDDDDDKKGRKKDKDKKDDDDKKVEELKFDLTDLDDRTVRMTIHSSSLADAVLTPDGKKLFYICRFEDKYDLWVHDFEDEKTKKIADLNSYGGDMTLSKDGKTLYIFASGGIKYMKTSGTSVKSVSYTGEFELDYQAEKAYLFEHAWRQIYRKFYVSDMHGVDWEKYKTAYSRFLPHINNNYDFAEMLSELLGELNGSHTGSGYRHRDPQGYSTASLGVLFDWNYTGEGIKIDEVLPNGPFDYAESKVKAGNIIKKIDGKSISSNTHFFELLNKKQGDRVLVELSDGSKTWEEVVKPISWGMQNQLLYERWVETMRAETEKLSGGRLGYVHVRGMNSSSFRQVYSDLFGRNAGKEAIIIDTRFNGGGWLHDDLAVLLSGKKYVEYVPREQKMGHDPMSRWTKPSILLMSESNYSDAHAFPFVYNTLEIGKTVGMPVPGTMTAVWWETLIDRTLYFGIPQVGSMDMDGNYLENQQLEPDIKVRQHYEKVINKKDEQLEKAVEELLKQL